MLASIRSLTLYRTVAALVCALVGVVALPAVAHADPIFSVTGRGWGHGIGMTQYGAYGYALQGKTYDWIVGHYFQHTSLATRAEPIVKVDLDAGKAARSSWRIASASGSTTLTVRPLTGVPSVAVTRGAEVWITFKGGAVVLSKDKVSGTTHAVGSTIATFPVGSAVTASNGSETTGRLTLFGKSGPFSNTDIIWRGQIRFTPSTSTGHAINYVGMESYIRGVVPRESPSSWPAEALKAQAVAARSYAYDSVSSGSTLWCTTQSQVYNGSDGATGSHEAASTDAAVKATANQYIVYGTKVVQAFFSSSAGGHTANIEDVWPGSSPQPYYTGVTSGEPSTSPNYRWTLANMTGTTLGAKIRDYDNGTSNTDGLDYSAPSPATLTNIKLDTAASGFVRHVTFVWSNGKSYTQPGSKLQSILGLKSTAYAVKVTNPTPVPTRYQDTDSRPLYSGTWASAKNSSASGGGYHRSVTKGATWTVSFKGTTFAWIGLKTDHAGKADVSLDGTRVATVDLYSSSTKYKSTIWSKTGLSSTATHTVVIKVLGTHRSGSGGSYVYVDAADVTGSLVTVPRPPAWKRYDQTSTKVAYKGTWAKSAVSGAYGGTHAYSHETSATAKFTFTGTQVRWIGKRASSYGKAWVSVDASAPVLVDLYSSTTKNQQRLFQSATLAAGTHTLTIRVAGTKNARSTYHYVDVDAFEALEPVK